MGRTDGFRGNGVVGSEPVAPLGTNAQDVIGIAATGSGKTLAFLLPAFSSLVAREKSSAADEWNLQIGFHLMKFLWIYQIFSQ